MNVTPLQALFRRAQLKALVDLHGTGAGFGGTLSEDEVHVIRGALDLTSKVGAAGAAGEGGGC